MPAIMDNAPREAGIPSKAVPKQGVARKTSRLQQRKTFLFRFPAMDDNRLACFFRHFKLPGKGLVLQFPRAVIPVKIKPDFTHRRQAAVVGKSLLNRIQAGRGAFQAVARVNAKDKIHFRMIRKKLPARLIIFRA